ncbi:hypothetical protein [Corynebacterium pseudopelargi]|uniref:Lipoprotein n=1 Tax=Corynebacterium pseudopelargi TaxID=2080757 RepID=A0A3G6J1R5_9CORY|nr:hypothetical protein [Corynebacterium pseudopelargi]AZA10084.1 hypothetical protein CPPEL_09905 [Corynebacterium pseudopelargi]
MKTAKIAAYLLVPALALGACSNDSDDANSAKQESSQTQENAGSNDAPNNASNDKRAALGERVETSIQPENDIFMTVNSVDFASECKFGVAEFQEAPQVGPDQEIMQISGVFEVERYEGPMAQVLPAMPGTPMVVTADGFTQDAETLVSCAAPDDGQQNWSTPTPVGSKVKVFGEFLVPKGTEEVIIDGMRFPTS